MKRRWIPYSAVDDVKVVAAPLGYYGFVSDLWMGPRRQCITQARADAEFAARCIDGSELGCLI